jgi:hypothetical protein
VSVRMVPASSALAKPAGSNDDRPYKIPSDDRLSKRARKADPRSLALEGIMT